MVIWNTAPLLGQSISTDIVGLGGAASDNCGIDSLYYFDTQTGTCPIVITRTFVVVDSCNNRAECTQEIHIDDTTIPFIMCPGPQTIEACGVYDLASLSQVGMFEYSEFFRIIFDEDDFRGIGGDVSDLCGIDSLYYFDVQTGTCPIVVTRTFVAVDSCDNRVECQQEIQINDTTDPQISCPGAVVLESCGIYNLGSTPAVGNLEYCEIARIIGLGDIQGLGGDASDNCGIDSLYYFDSQLGTCPIVITRTFVVIDSCGNTAECEQEIQINDTTDPTLTCPPDDILEACGVDDLATSPQVGNLEYSVIPRTIDVTDIQGIGGDAFDNCGLDSLYYFDSQTGSCPIIMTRTFVAVDSCGNRVECNQEIQIDDTTDPELTCPADQVIEGCDESILQSSPVVGNLEYSEAIREILVADILAIGGDAFDNCAIDSLYYFDIQSGFCPIVITRTFVAVDSCGNRVECQQEIQIIDTTVPLITCPGPQLLELCDVDDLVNAPEVGFLEYSQAVRSIDLAELVGIGGTASDECGIDSLFYFDSQDGACPIIVIRTFVVVDSCGNRAECTQEIEIEDSTDPQLSCPVNQVIEGCGVYDLANAPEVGMLEYSESPRIIAVGDLQGLGGDASDNCGIDSLYYVDAQTGSCPIIVTRTFVVVDSCGNRMECPQEIQINDTTDPSLTCPSNEILEACGVYDLATNAAVGNLEYSESQRDISLGELQAIGGDATDNCGIDSLYYFDSQAESCPIIVTRTFVAVDSCGNRVECQQEIQIDDTTEPTISCPDDAEVLGCSTDDLALAPEVGNFEFSTSIRPIETAEFESLGGSVDDHCGIDSIYYFDTQDGACPIVVTRTFVAVDSCGNSTQCEQTIEINDTEEPVIQCPQRQVISGCDVEALATSSDVGNLEFSEVNRPLTVPEFQSIGGTLTDNCFIQDFYYTDVISGSCPLTVTRTFVAVDSCGNEAECTAEIEIDNLGEPSISCPDAITLEACSTDELENFSEVGFMAFSEVATTISLADFQSIGGGATDNCGIASVQYQDELLEDQCPIVVERTYTVTDSCNLTASCSQLITLVDVEPPMIECIPNRIYDCKEEMNRPFTTLIAFERQGGSVSDNCQIDPASFTWISDVSDGNTCPEIIVRTYQIADWCGNTQTCTQTIRINDSIPPEFVGIPEDVTVTCDEVPDPPQIGLQIQVIENCGTPDIDFVEEIIPGDCENTYDIIRTWTASDSCGNTAIAIQQITVIDCYPDVEIQINPNPACLGHDVTLQATVSDFYSNPVYRWQVFKSGFWIDVPGGNGLTHVINDVQMSDEATYRFIVADKLSNLTDPECSVISDEVELRITPHSVTDLVEEICLGESFTVGTSSYSQTGSYTDVLIGPNGCDSIVNLDLVVNVPTTSTINPTICDGESFIIGSSVLTTTGTFTEILTNTKGCDSTVTINLTVIIPTTTNVSETICEGTSISIAGEDFSEAGNYLVTLSDRHGCDSLINIDIQTIAPIREDLVISICDGQTYTAAGIDHSETGLYSYTLLSDQTGCDSVLTLDLTVNTDIQTTLNQSICVGDSILVGSNYYSESGTFVENLIAAAGCDSVVTLNLQVVDTLKTFLVESICEGETIAMGGSNYSMTGVYETLLISNGGCDSLINLDLTVHPLLETFIDTAVCAGEFLSVGGEILTDPGVYDITTTSVAGCDSVIHVDLEVNDPYDTTYTINLCAGEAVTIGSESYDATGVFTQNHLTSSGCDSIIVVNVTVFPTYEIFLTEVLCEGNDYTVGPSTYNTTGNYTDVLTSASGCDSIIHLDLTVLTDIEVTIDEQICDGNTYSFGGNSLAATGTYQEVFISSGGCDSIVTLNLQVLTVLTTTLDEEICEGGSYDFDGDQTFTAGTYTKSYTSQAGCDSVVTLNLSVVTSKESTTLASICEGETYTFGSRQLSESGLYQDSLISVAGCDSISILDLTVWPILNTDLNVQRCIGQTYNFGGELLDQSGTYLDTLSSSNGCDSIVTLQLVIHEVLRDTVFAQICENQFFPFNGQDYDASGFYDVVLPSSLGCDSIVTLALEVNTRLETELFEEICFGESFEFFAETLTTAGIYEHILLSSSGCDSAIVLNLTIRDQITSEVEVQVCLGQTFLFDGQEISTDGTYSATFTAANGCDSLATINVVTKDVLTTTLDEQICLGDSYTFGSLQIDTAGVFVDSLISANGCDSIVTLNLAVLESKSDTLDIVICEGQTYFFDEQDIGVAGTYTSTQTSADGCDSTTVLNLDINSTLTHTIDTAICFGTDYDFFGESLSSSGIYQQTLSSTSGCDSVVFLNLTVLEVLETTIDRSICNGRSTYFAG